ncbi:MAG: RIP metalloprotease RseP [Bacteriovoracaceae bacterium]|nr:RIP metalloprotease RseP [Bacteriovoracaceae bacterium]
MDLFPVVIIKNIAIFALFLCPLIFFHELGHFLFANLFKVRVEVFSIGFGKKLLKWKKNHTEYAISLIPFGGYIKMFGDDPMQKDKVAVEDRPFSFTHKGKWARFWIVFGGPLANFLLAFFIFFVLLYIGEKTPEIKMSVVPKDSQYYKLGLLTGDVVVKVNNQELRGHADVEIDENIIVNTITIKRADSYKTLKINIDSKTFFEGIRRLSPLRKPIIVDKYGKKYTISIDKLKYALSLDEMAESSGSKTIHIKPMLTGGRSAVTFDLNFTDQKQFFNAILQRGYLPLDLQVFKLKDNSPAHLAGMQKGDVIFALQNRPISNFLELKDTLQKTADGEVTVGVWRDGKSQNFKLTPSIEEHDGSKLKLIGVHSAVEYQMPNLVTTKSKGFLKAVTQGMQRSVDTLMRTFRAFKQLVTNKVSIKNVGGPITIAKIAADSFDMSLSYFFQIMALISVNLGLINLFPIPVLDGGHIMFILFEIVNRGPLSKRKLEIAQQIGLSLLLLLTVLSLFNDISRLF